MLLTEAERKKFIEYLRQDIMSNKLLLKPLKVLGVSALIKVKEQLILAEEIVLKMLESTHKG